MNLPHCYKPAPWSWNRHNADPSYDAAAMRLLFVPSRHYICTDSTGASRICREGALRAEDSPNRATAAGPPPPRAAATIKRQTADRSGRRRRDYIRTRIRRDLNARQGDRWGGRIGIRDFCTMTKAFVGRIYHLRPRPVCIVRRRIDTRHSEGIEEEKPVCCWIVSLPLPAHICTRLTCRHSILDRSRYSNIGSLLSFAATSAPRQPAGQLSILLMQGPPDQNRSIGTLHAGRDVLPRYSIAAIGSSDQHGRTACGPAGSGRCPWDLNKTRCDLIPALDISCVHARLRSTSARGDPPLTLPGVLRYLVVPLPRVGDVVHYPPSSAIYLSISLYFTLTSSWPVFLPYAIFEFICAQGENHPRGFHISRSFSFVVRNDETQSRLHSP